MRVLLVHQNFPGQFRHLSPLLAADGHEVVALTIERPPADFGARIVRTTITHAGGTGHPWARDLDTKIVRGEASFRRALALRADGFVPDLIIAHPGWGDALFLKDVWPEARVALYCEYYYRAAGADLDFDPEFTRPEPPVEARVRMRLRNLPQRLLFDVADGGLSPTCFQADSYPSPFRDRITVIHDGIDTGRVAPGPARAIRLPDGRRIMPGDEIVTFVSRTLEPYRGIHMLLRAWPAIQQARPRARLVVVGRDGAGYGPAPPPGTGWKERFLAEAGDTIDPARVIFTGTIGYESHLNLLRLSTVHIYLTYPFVLSWSLIEAMATGCAILGSDTAPVREFIRDGETGVLAPFFDAGAIARGAIDLLGAAATRHALGRAARDEVVRRLDLATVVQPKQREWLDRLMAGGGATTVL